MKERKYRNAASSNLSSDRLLKETLAILLLLLNSFVDITDIASWKNLSSTFQLEKGQG